MAESALYKALRGGASLPRDLQGRAIVSDVERRWSRRAVGLATVWFAAVSLWEIFGPILAGHYASSASMGIIADNMLRWGIPGPVWEYTPVKPSPAQYYCHHPWGIFWTTTGLFRVLGHHDYVCRLPAALLSIATPPLLSALGRAIWRPAAGAAAALSFVVLPISLSFAQFNALEVPVMAWCLLGSWGYVRWTQRPARRHLLASWLGLLMALNADWPAFVWAGALLAFGLLRGMLLPARTFGALDQRRHAQWWALWSTTAVLTLVCYVVLFHRAGKLFDLYGAYTQRSAGFEQPFLEVLASRRYWLELCFTPIALWLGGAALLLGWGRLLVARREHEMVPLAFFAMAAVQYVVFRQGADLHVFWPHYFAAYFALGMGGVVAWLAPRLDMLGALRRRVGEGAGALAAMGIMLVPLLAIARDGVEVLVYARETGGRFNEKGLLIDSDGDKTAFLRWLEPQLSPVAKIDMHQSMRVTWAQTWALNQRIVRAGARKPKPGASDRPFLADVRYLRDEVATELAGRFHVTAVGPFWKIDPSEPASPMTVHSFVESEPNAWQWALVSATEPQRRVEEDPFATWENRIHYVQPAEPVTKEPASIEQLRIAHNVSVYLEQSERAAALRDELRSRLEILDVAYDEGTVVVGTLLHEGVRDELTIYLRAAGASEAEVRLEVWSEVVEGPAWSTTMADPLLREVAPPMRIPSSRWRAGFIYSTSFAVRARPGVELFQAAFVERSGRRPQRTDGRGGRVDVLRL